MQLRNRKYTSTMILWEQEFFWFSPWKKFLNALTIWSFRLCSQKQMFVFQIPSYNKTCWFTCGIGITFVFWWKLFCKSVGRGRVGKSYGKGTLWCICWVSLILKELITGYEDEWLTLLYYFSHSQDLIVNSLLLLINISL